MIGDILNAIMQECRALLGEKKGTVILKTDYKPAEKGSYNMPLLIVDLIDAPDAFQLIGGSTRMDWNIAMNSYAYMPDPTIDDTTGDARNLLNVIDEIRQHFSIKNWLNTSITPTMNDVLNNYCFKYTLSGIQTADALDEDGLVMGYKIIFDSVGIDTTTSLSEDSTQVLNTVQQINNPPFN